MAKRRALWPTVAGTSFFPAKPLGCYGDGGMIFTDNKEMYDQLLSIRVHGQGADKYTNVRVGINGRMDSCRRLSCWPRWRSSPRRSDLRQEVAARYDRLLAGSVKTPKILPENVSAWAQYSVLHPAATRSLKNCAKTIYPLLFITRSRCTCRRLLPIWVTAKVIFPSPKRSPGKYSACPCTPIWKEGTRKKFAKSLVGSEG